MYKIWWILNGIVKEEIYKDRPVPKSVAEWKLKELKRTTHKTGELKVVKADKKPEYYRQREVEFSNEPLSSIYDRYVQNPFMMPELPEDY
jgi:hypothetical protein